jgi:hypothetical protein
MKLILNVFQLGVMIINFASLKAQNNVKINILEGKPPDHSCLFHPANDPLLQYTGRIKTKNVPFPRFWSPGIYVKAKFYGKICDLFLNDEELYGNSHNYIEVILDERKPQRLQTKWKKNVVRIEGLSDTDHTLIICKNTESGIGYLEFAGIDCKKLLTLPEKATRKIEFIGNSITCGNAMDFSELPCGKMQWYDQQNAYMSYGPVTARALHAQWVLSAVSGIGMIHSCCNMNITMPEVFDKIDMRDDSIQWNFKNYIPDVVTICLGQNDGIQDSAKFCRTYANFIRTIRSKYLNTEIICLTSPMANTSLTAVLKRYLFSIVAEFSRSGDKKVTKYFFSKQYNHGCMGHPDIKEHQLIAAELINYIKDLKHW